ncbi:MAG TPA: UDP-N-acetylmuramoyl-L-alanine--D-glutamate ligase [Acidimicrobiia bacterium]
MKVLVLGAAVSGRAAASLARRRGHEVAVYDADTACAAALRDEGFVVHSGAWTAHHVAGADLVVASPGFPEVGQPIRDALGLGVPLVSEMEFAAGNLRAPYAAVTGTNGKTTVVSAAAAMVEASGRKVVAAGNIGTALSDVVDEPWDAVVVEASSFQLRFVDRFHPIAAAVTNVAPDHLDWHGSFEAYATAKARIIENQTGDDLLAYDADDPGASALAAMSPSRKVAVSGRTLPAGGYGIVDGDLVLGSLQVPAPDLGAAFLADLAIAAAIAGALGASAEGISAAVTAFAPGAHRRAVVGSWGGVTWVDDSKATNPHAAVEAASAYPSVVLLAGGRNKGLDLRPLAEAATVSHFVGIGEAAGELAAMVPSARFTYAAGMDEAVAAAARIARAGDVVLLAPGCASFDMFTSYGQRGDAFAAAARRLMGDE